MLGDVASPRAYSIRKCGAQTVYSLSGRLRMSACRGKIGSSRRRLKTTRLTRHEASARGTHSHHTLLFRFDSQEHTAAGIPPTKPNTETSLVPAQAAVRTKTV